MPTSVTAIGRDAAASMSRSTSSLKRKSPGGSFQLVGSSAAFSMYLQQRQEDIHAILAKNRVSQTTIDMSGMIAEEWNGLDPSERRVWEDKATNSRCSPGCGKPGSGLVLVPSAVPSLSPSSSALGWHAPKKKRRRQPGAPKRPMSAYFDFANSRRAAVKQENMSAGNGEISRILAAMWRNAPADLKKPYTDREAANWAQYKQEMEAWQFELLSAPVATASALGHTGSSLSPSPSPSVVSDGSLGGLDALAAACQQSVDGSEGDGGCCSSSSTSDSAALSGVVDDDSGTGIEIGLPQDQEGQNREFPSQVQACRQPPADRGLAAQIAGGGSGADGAGVGVGVCPTEAQVHAAIASLILNGTGLGMAQSSLFCLRNHPSDLGMSSLPPNLLAYMMTMPLSLPQGGLGALGVPQSLLPFLIASETAKVLREQQQGTAPKTTLSVPAIPLPLDLSRPSDGASGNVNRN